MRHPVEFIRRRLLARSAVSADRSWGGVPCREFRVSLRRGYGRLWDGERVVQAHWLALEVWVGPTPAGRPYGLHRCDNPACIEPRHLWWGTQAENMADRDAKGRGRNGAEPGVPKPWLRGERHPLAKLDEARARELKRRVRGRARVRMSVLAREYGVSESLVRAVRDGRAWGWL